MTLIMRNCAITLLLLCLATIWTTERAAAQTRAAKPTVTLEGLLKQGEVEYIKSGTFYKAPIEFDNEVVVLYLSEQQLFEKSELKNVTVFSFVLTLPKGQRPPAAMLKKMAVLNGNMTVGRYGFDEASNSITYSSSFWLNTATLDILYAEIALAHINCVQGKKDLKPFLTE